jgi:rare lipoprotein A
MNGWRCARFLAAISSVAAVVLVAGGLPVQSASAGEAKTQSFAGLCAFYSESGHVASGGRFDPNGLTAAHRTLPFGTRIRVTDAKTGRNVIVTINDRGPFGKGRVLDLSPAAAKALGMIDRGVIYVKADVL